MCFHFFFAGCPIHPTTDHQMSTSFCHIWPKQILTGFLCTDCSSREELGNPQRKYPFPAIWILWFSVHSACLSRSSTLENGDIFPCFLALPIEKMEVTTWFHLGFLPNPLSGELGLTEAFCVFTLFLSDSHSAAYFWAVYSGSYNHVSLFFHFGYLKLSVNVSESCAEGDVGLPAVI